MTASKPSRSPRTQEAGSTDPPTWAPSSKSWQWGFWPDPWKLCWQWWGGWSRCPRRSRPCSRQGRPAHSAEQGGEQGRGRAKLPEKVSFSLFHPTFMTKFYHFLCFIWLSWYVEPEYISFTLITNFTNFTMFTSLPRFQSSEPPMCKEIPVFTSFHFIHM